MPRNIRIIKRGSSEVNGSSWILFVRNGDCALGFRLVCCLLLSLLVLSSCAGNEGRAEHLYDKAQREVRDGDLQAAIEICEKIVENYPTTETARLARRQIVLYRGLEEAVRSYPVRTARDLIVQTARAIERYRSRHRSWPPDLERLVPRYLPRPAVDPWGRELHYRPKPRGRGYILACFGEDGAPGGEGDSADWFVEDGKFVLQPSRGLM